MRAPALPVHGPFFAFLILGPFVAFLILGLFFGFWIDEPFLAFWTHGLFFGSARRQTGGAEAGSGERLL